MSATLEMARRDGESFLGYMSSLNLGDRRFNLPSGQVSGVGGEASWGTGWGGKSGRSAGAVWPFGMPGTGLPAFPQGPAVPDSSHG